MYIASNSLSRMDVGHLIYKTCRRNIDYMYIASNSLPRMKVDISYMLVESVEEISTTCI